MMEPISFFLLNNDLLFNCLNIHILLLKKVNCLLFTGKASQSISNSTLKHNLMLIEPRHKKYKI